MPTYKHSGGNLLDLICFTFDYNLSKNTSWRLTVHHHSTSCIGQCEKQLQRCFVFNVTLTLPVKKDPHRMNTQTTNSLQNCKWASKFHQWKDAGVDFSVGENQCIRVPSRNILKRLGGLRLLIPYHI